MLPTLIKGAFVIDPGTNTEGYNDIVLKNGKVKEVGKDISVGEGYCVYDATGLIACPGFIDFHVHGYEYVTPLGINVDEQCLMKGVTTVVDAGSSGASTFLGLKKYIMDTSKTRVKAFLHIANHGLASAGCAGIEKGGECDSLNQVNVQQCVECIKTYPDDIIGVKVRLSESVCADGKNENEVYNRALEASVQAKLPLMIHHAFSSIQAWKSDEKLTCPGSLRNGDIYIIATL